MRPLTPPTLTRATALLLAVAAAVAAQAGVQLSGRADEGAGQEAGQAPDRAAERRAPLRKGDEFWVVSTRHLPDASGPDGAAQLTVYKMDSQGVAGASTVEQLAQGDAALPTVIYLHGNRRDYGQSVGYAWVYYHLLATDSAPAFRFILWSWPSEKQVRGLADFRVKADRADGEAWYFAGFLRDWQPSRDVRMVGYSYGARTAGGALHLLAGGTLNGRQLPPPVSDKSPRDATVGYRVALLAPASHHHAFAQGSFHGEAPAVVDQWFVTLNHCDPALRRYRIVSRCDRAVALGAVGLDASALGPHAPRWELADVSSQVGRTHDEESYLASPHVVQRLRELLLGVK